MGLAVRCSRLGGLSLVELRRSHLEAWITRMDADGLAPGTIKIRVDNARAVLRAAAVTGSSPSTRATA